MESSNLGSTWRDELRSTPLPHLYAWRSNCWSTGLNHPPKETSVPQPENSNSSTGWHEQIFWQRTTEIKGEPAKLGLRINNQEDARSIMSNLGPKLFMGAQNMKFDLYKIWQLYSGLIYQEKVEPNMYAMSKAKTPELWKTGRTLNKNPATTLRAWEVAAASVKTSSTFAGHRVGDASAPTWCGAW